MTRRGTRYGARSRAAAWAFIVASLALGCAGFNPQPLEEVAFLERLQTQEREGLRVSVAVQSRDEARRAFGIDLEGGT